MANEQNLKTPTTAEARERGKKGGIASAKAKKRRKEFRESFETILSMPLKDGQSADVEAIKNYASLKGKNISVQEAIIISIAQKAMKGDVRAAEYIRDTIGEKPKEKVEVGGDLKNPFAGLSTEELKKLIENE